MPFITEEIWQNLLNGPTIVLAEWPEPAGFSAPSAERAMETIMAVITEIRTIRSEKNVSPGRKITAICQGTPDVLTVLEENMEDIKTLAGLEQLILEPGENRKIRQCCSKGNQSFLTTG